MIALTLEAGAVIFCAETSRLNRISGAPPMEAFEAFLSELAARPIVPPSEQNFFDVGGSGYLENPTSDLLALFMGAQPTVPRWLAKALVSCLIDKGCGAAIDVSEISWDAVTAEREVSEIDLETDTRKRLDLLVACDQFVLGIENKVYAGAGANPFHVYDCLLSSRAAGREIVRCVLRATSRTDDLPINCDWPVVTYLDLVHKARSLYGHDVACGPITKWGFFYSEFLKHLESLATPDHGGTMSDADLTFVSSHFGQLRRAQGLLEQFETDLLRRGQAVVASALSRAGIDTNVKTAVHSWRNGYRALRFRPQNWGGQSDVVLVFFDRSESDSKDQVGYRLHAYVRKGSEHVPLDTIRALLDRTARSGEMSWVNEKDEGVTWFESDRKWLGLRAYASDRTLEGSLTALGDLAQWLQQHAFTSAS